VDAPGSTRSPAQPGYVGHCTAAAACARDGIPSPRTVTEHCVVCEGGLRSGCRKPPHPRADSRPIPGSLAGAASMAWGRWNGLFPVPENSAASTDLDLINAFKAIADARIRNGIHFPACQLRLVALLVILCVDARACGIRSITPE
jgi:hypothetical protein